MINERDVRAVDEVGGAFGRRAAHDEQTRQPGWARHARQALQRAQRVAARAGNAGDLTPLERATCDLTRRTLTLDSDFDAFRYGRQTVLHVTGFTGHDVFFALEIVEARGFDGHLVLAGRKARKLEGAVGRRRCAELLALRCLHDDLGAGKRSIRTLDEELAFQVALRRRRRRR
jgi:hypothetical protein